MTRRPSMKRQEIARPLVLASVLTLGTATVWTMIVMWTVVMVEKATRSRFVSYYIAVQADGTPFIQKMESSNRPVVPIASSEQFTLDGDRIEGKSDISTLYGAPLWQEVHDTFGRPEWSERVSQFPVRGASDDSPADASMWYFIHDGLDDGRGYFVGYELTGNRCIGYMGVNGFAHEKPSRDSWFVMSRGEYAYGLAIRSKIYSTIDRYNNRHYPLLVRSGDLILEVDLGKRTVRTVFQGSSLLAMSRISRARVVPTSDFRPGIEQMIAVRMPNEIAVVSLDGKIVGKYVLPKSFQADPASQFFTLPNEQALLVNSRTDRTTGLVSAKLSWIDTAGNVLGRRDVTLGKPEPVRNTSGEDAIAAVAFPAPGIMVPALALMGAPWLEQERHPELSYAQAIGPGIARAWPALLGLLILGAALSWACVRRQNKYALPWTKTWAVFVFFFGIPGYLGYLCHRRWPVHEECPECHKTTPQDRGACALCDTPLPTPAPKGIEIFA